MVNDLEWYVVVEFNQASGQPQRVELVQGRTDAEERRAQLEKIARVSRRRETCRIFALEEVEDAHTDEQLAAIERKIDKARAEGFAAAVAMLRDDRRYTGWWTALPREHPDYGYWQRSARRHLADYLETVDIWACKASGTYHCWKAEPQDMTLADVCAYGCGTCWGDLHPPDGGVVGDVL